MNSQMKSYILTGDKTEIPIGTTHLILHKYFGTPLVVPAGVIRLDCSDNQLTELIVPKSVFGLYCDNNQLIELIVPEGVVDLDCDNNIYPNELLLIRGELSHIRKNIAVRKAISRMRKPVFQRHKDIFDQITHRPAGIVGTWDLGGYHFQKGVEEVYN